MDYENIKSACESSVTMSEAARKLGLNFQTFKRRAIGFGLYKPNQGQRGVIKSVIKLIDVFEGRIQLRSNQLRKRLIAEGYKENKCEKCGNEGIWENEPITLELDHINGVPNDNRLENLRILCPNCHSQTPTFRNRGTRDK